MRTSHCIEHYQFIKLLECLYIHFYFPKATYPPLLTSRSLLLRLNIIFMRLGCAFGTAPTLGIRVLQLLCGRIQ